MDRRAENRVCRLRTMPGSTASDAWVATLRAARGDEVFDLDIMRSVVVEAAAYEDCLIDSRAIAAEC